MRCTAKQTETRMLDEEKEGVNYKDRSTRSENFFILQLDHLRIRAGRSGVQYCEFQGYINDKKWNCLDSSYMTSLETLKYLLKNQLFKDLEKYDLFNQHILWTYDKSSYTFQHYLLGASSLLCKTTSKLERILFDVYKNQIIMNSYDYGVIIPEPFFFPSHLKQILHKVLLDLRFKSIQYVPESLLYCFGSGIRNAIIVDVSWEGVYIIPVYDLRVLNSSVKATNRGYKILHYSGSRTLDVNDFDSVFYELEKYAAYSASVEEVKGIFFPSEDNEHPLDDEEQSVSKLLMELVQELPIDIRKELQNKILVTNKFLVPHFREILQEEVGSIGTKIFSPLDVWQCTSLYADYFLS
ncbi:hypothetical protein LJB42_001439 [Komagataella kurtzmanii]|nr:hypothetical protein LJB42_001439 [Komagataella kurtzmanii]